MRANKNRKLIQISDWRKPTARVAVHPSYQVTLMKTKFLATTALVLLGLSGAAWAQQTTPTGASDLLRPRVR